VYINKKMISSYNEWCIGKFPGVCTISFNTSTRYLKFMFYHIVIWNCWDTLDFPHFYAQTVLWWLKTFLENRADTAILEFIADHWH